MNLEPATAEIYLRHAFTEILGVADRLGDERVNRRPHGDTTNAVAALVIHCCAVTEFWLGHVALGRPSDRDRDSEFSRTSTVAELHELVETTMTTAASDVRRLEAGAGTDDAHLRGHLQGGDTSDASVVIHVLEELYQHLGHMELTADALGAPPRS